MSCSGENRLPPRRARSKREQGVALIIVLVGVAILASMLAEMTSNSRTAYAVGRMERESLQAEYMAKSGINLTRMLVGQEPALRALATPIYQSFFGRPPPVLPVWGFANDILRPFCDPSGAAASGFTFGELEATADLPGQCEIIAFAENSRINVNQPLFFEGDRARANVAVQLFAHMGGYQSPSPYDPIFSGLDPDGQITSRQDVVSAIIDWWDIDTDRTNFDPGAAEVTSSGPEEDLYTRLDDPYRAKNAPFDSLEELRLVRGVSDDFWANFIDPDPNDPSKRKVTIYGSGAVNPNEAPPEVILARICAYLSDQPLCADPLEAAKFIQLVNTLRALIPLPVFSRSQDVANFISGAGGENDLYQQLVGYLGEDHPLLFTPVTIPEDQRSAIDGAFVTGSRILSVNAIGRAGCPRGPQNEDDLDYDPYDCRVEMRISTVLNFHERWTPPPPNAGSMPALGIFHYYRVE